MLGITVCLWLFAACDDELVLPSEPVAYCDAFDERCLHCESIGVGASCTVQGEPGTCIDMRIVQGPQVYIAGLRCRAD